MTPSITIDYTNWRGERALRRIRPRSLFFGTAPLGHHVEPQWLLDAYDVEKDAPRTFAMRNIHAWGDLEPSVRPFSQSVAPAADTLERDAERSGIADAYHALLAGYDAATARAVVAEEQRDELVALVEEMANCMPAGSGAAQKQFRLHLLAILARSEADRG